MHEERILAILKSAIAIVLGDLAPCQISPEDSLREMGANSVDRVEILLCTMEELNLPVPMISFAVAENLGDIVEIFLIAMREAG